MQVLMEYPAEPVAASYVKARDLVRRQWYWQWLERAGVGDALVWPVRVVEVLELPQRVQQVALLPVGFHNLVTVSDLQRYA
jgi:hypothetical protein